MFVNDDIYYFLSDMTENEKRKERLPDDMFCNTCKSTLLHIFFLETAVLLKSLSFYHPLTNLSLASVGFLLVIETLIIILATKRSVV